jgi:twinkle protein
MSIIQDYKAVGIDIPANRNSGQFKMACPRASSHCNRKNWKDQCLSINMDEGLYNCQHCTGEFKGKVGEGKIETNYTKKKEYQLPQRPNITKLSDKTLEYFTNRRITQDVLVDNKVAESDGWIIYPYMMDGQLVNFQKRKIGEKDFRQATNAKPIVFNYDRCMQNVTTGNGEIIITEGVEDAMSWGVAGFPYHTSVNQGAPNSSDSDASNKIACIDHCYSLFEKATVVYIASDNDPNGKRLQQELIRRIGEEKCKIIDFGKYKDSNEYLKFEGVDKLKELKEKARFVKIAEVYTARDAKDEIVRQITQGRVKGETTYFPKVDSAWTWRKKELNLWSGYANEGKSAMFNQLALLKAIHDGWKFAIFSPENFPVEEFFDDLLHMYIGKSTDNTHENCMSKEEAIDGLDFLEGHFFIVYPDNNYTIEHIHSKFNTVIKRHGIDAVVIDPFNWLSNRQSGGMNRDQFVTQMLSNMKRFCNEKDVSYNLVAHQLKPEKEKSGNYVKPDPYKVKGASDFMDKADNVLLVQRPFVATDYRNPLVEFTSAKIKKPKLVGKRGVVVELNYDYKTMRYYQVDDGYCPLAQSHFTPKDQAIAEYERGDVFKGGGLGFEDEITDEDWQT